MAVKVINLEEADEDVTKEIAILRKCKNPYVVQYLGSSLRGTDLWVRLSAAILARRARGGGPDAVGAQIVMEYCGAGSVSDLCGICERTLDEDELAEVMASMLLGLKYLHESKLIHRVGVRAHAAGGSGAHALAARRTSRPATCC